MIPIRDDNPSYTVPYITIALIIINSLIFLYILSLGPDQLQSFFFGAGAIPARFTNDVETPGEAIPVWATLFSSMFMHGGFLHILGNMWYLWLFGDNVEDRLGPWRFVAFYVICGVAALGAQILSSPSSEIPIIGASGAIAGVLGAYIVLYPKATVRTLIWLILFVQVIRVPAVFFLGFWFFLQFVQSLGAFVNGNGVAWFAHLGGFVAGALLIKPLTLGRKYPPPGKELIWDGFGKKGRKKDDIF